MIVAATIGTVAAAAAVSLLTWDASPPALVVLLAAFAVGAGVYLWGVIAFGAGADLQRVRELARRRPQNS